LEPHLVTCGFHNLYNLFGKDEVVDATVTNIATKTDDLA
jgi:hypothetical protein